MQCPDCKEKGKVVWFLRHQKTNDEDTGTAANVITILCQTCGKNESVFLTDFLGEMFPDWDEERELKKQMLGLFSNLNQNSLPTFEGENIESNEDPTES